ncbi:XRE family transcriptional regulator [Bifidobacterium stellenboschense]|uniref:XRE family transcriptional regulator n=2 Tax=Bifidobacterium stellenboschense TaxID=762211 RepID=A0A087DJQ7_9BIFI|nr:XRE family transcriptional regulator [Bifidobacterium stellenboschense]
MTMTFRTNLQTLRARRNMTQEQLAMLLGVSRQAISKWESEKAYPEMDKLLAICDLFGCTLDDLVLGDVDRPATPARTTDATPTVADDPHAVEQREGGPTTPLPKDITGYDAHRLRFSMLIASGVTAIIASVGVANLFDPEHSIIGVNPLNDFLMFVCICVGVIIGLVLLVPGAMAHAAFRRNHPYVKDFYTEDDRRRESRLLACGVVAGVAAILIGIAVVVYMDEVREVTAGWPNAVMLLLSAAAVFGFVYCGMRYTMVNIDGYNKEIERNRRQRSGDVPRSVKLSGALSGIIMLVATIVGLTLLFLVPESLFWMSWVIGGLLCAITGIIVDLFKDHVDK